MSLRDPAAPQRMVVEVQQADGGVTRYVTDLVM
jgi:hypothetical protein